MTALLVTLAFVLGWFACAVFSAAKISDAELAARDRDAALVNLDAARRRITQLEQQR